MTPEERWERIEEKHLALAESLELLTHDIHSMQEAIHFMQENRIAMQEEQKRLDRRDRAMRTALLQGVAAFLRELGAADDDTAGG